MPRGSILFENDDRGGGGKPWKMDMAISLLKPMNFQCFCKVPECPPPSGHPSLLRFDNDEDADALETLRSWKAGMAGSWEVEKLGSLTRRGVVTVGRGW